MIFTTAWAFTGPRNGTLPQKLADRFDFHEGEFLVGCCTGTDEQVISAVLEMNKQKQLTIFAAYGPDGGHNQFSARGIVALAAERGARVIWWAGGRGTNVAHRLIDRSRAMVDALTQSAATHKVLHVITPGNPEYEFRGTGSWKSCGSGTWSTAAYAAQNKRCDILLHPMGGQHFVPITLPTAGTWTTSVFGGMWYERL